MKPAVRAAIERALGRAIRSVEAVAGGDINEAFALELQDGERVFAKSNRDDIAGLFEAEARGLAWLGEARVLRLPRVLAVTAATGEAAAPGFLVLEWIEPGPPARDFDERLGRGLACLHRFGAPSFGLGHDNFIGRLPQSNGAPSRRDGATATWAEFYRDRRLGAQLELAKSTGRIDALLLRRFDELLSRLEEWVGPAEPPSRLHGDLWAGNLHTDRGGEPVLIDPAAYGGHREVDLAMMRLFGGFGPRVFEAYEEAHPLAPGHRERVALYQLYPLLVHLNLFGSSYLGQLSAALSQVTRPRTR